MVNIPTIQALEQRVQELEEQAEEREQLKKALCKRTKELTCLYAVSEIINRKGTGLAERLQQVAAVIPQGWQYSEIACAWVVLEGQEYTSDRFKNSRWRQAADIIVNKKKAGTIEVYYAEQRPECDEGPFLKEERALIDAIAERVSRFIERNRFRDAMVQARKEWETTFDSIRDFIFVTDQRGAIRRVNRFFAEKFEVNSTHFLGKKCNKIFGCNLLGTGGCPFLDLEQGQPITDHEIYLEGLDMWVSANIYSTFEPYGRLDHIVHVYRDITQTKALQESLVQTEKMSSMGVLVSGVAHELNNPLSGIIGHAEYLIEDRGLKGEILREVQVIKKEANRAARIVRNLLTFARHKEPQKGSVDINQALNDILDLREYHITTDNIGLVRRLDNTLPRISGDFYQIQQIFLNLINNAYEAIKLSGKGDKITVQTEPKAGRVHIEVADNGPGMSDEVKRKIFDPFFTTKEAGQGTGLGLSISHGIIKAHGGNLSVASSPGKGARFIIELPVGESFSAVMSEENAEKAVKGKRILVVDDELSVRRSMERHLKSLGHDVALAASGKAALKKLRSRTFDLLIVDLKMPGMDGMQLYETVVKMYPELKRAFVIMTGVMERNLEQFLSRTGCLYLEKPFRRGDVRKMLGKLF